MQGNAGKKRVHQSELYREIPEPQYERTISVDAPRMLRGNRERQMEDGFGVAGLNEFMRNGGFMLCR